MTARILPRDYGVVVECNRCGAKEQTAVTGKRRNRAFAKTKGWGRGTDRGTKYRAAEAAVPSVYGANGKVVERRKPAVAEISGRPKTLGHDLCPPCLKLDRDAAAARRAATTARRAARDAK